jgi:hypothetical protein
MTSTDKATIAPEKINCKPPLQKTDKNIREICISKIFFQNHNILWWGY